MALVGTVKFYRDEPDMDNPETGTVTYPEDLPETSSAYEKRGTSEEVTTYPNIRVLDNQIDNAYVIIKMCAMHLQDDNDGSHDNKHFNVFYRVNIYESLEARQEDIYENVLMEIDIDPIHYEDIDVEDWGTKSLLSYCYEHLKTQEGYEDLVND